jgi:hypothetical protein
MEEEYYSIMKKFTSEDIVELSKHAELVLLREDLKEKREWIKALESELAKCKKQLRTCENGKLWLGLEKKVIVNTEK